MEKKIKMFIAGEETMLTEKEINKILVAGSDEERRDVAEQVKNNRRLSKDTRNYASEVYSAYWEREHKKFLKQLREEGQDVIADKIECFRKKLNDVFERGNKKARVRRTSVIE